MAAVAAGVVAPFSGNFNPGTKLGNSTFLEKTKVLAEANCYDLNKASLLAIDADFSGGWTNGEHLNLETVLSRKIFCA